MANPYYSSGAALKAKSQLAGGATLDFPGFALGRLCLDDVRTALDAGCGWGRFAVPLLKTAHRLEGLLCADVWAGMVGTAQDTLTSAGLEASYLAADVCSLPLADRSFDLVMANHMLYELDDVSCALAELARVLKPGGQLLATTYSDAGAVPMRDLHFATMAAIGHPYPAPKASSFSLENGGQLLSRYFSELDCDVMEEMTSVTNPASFTAIYLETGGYDWARRDGRIPPAERDRIPETFQGLAQQWIDREGAISTRTRWTVFVARSPRVRTR